MVGQDGSVMRYADAQQYRAAAQPEATRSGPVVTLLNATPDPLGSVAALCAMYQGRVIRDLSELTDEDRRKALADMQSTELAGALEAAQFHFLIERVDRAFTHQMVRGRTAFYAQESLRFAVVEDWAGEVPLPPSLAGLPADDPRVRVWRRALNKAEDWYESLVHNGMPAEEARGLLPHAVLTRIQWVTNLRELLHVAGLRTCTQAQFIWRQVMAEVARALRGYCSVTGIDRARLSVSDAWQFETISNALRPVCYQKGRCGFMAQFDRSCNIRDRVERFAANGVPSDRWGTGSLDVVGDPTQQTWLQPIFDHEWAADPGAARVVPHAGA